MSAIRPWVPRAIRAVSGLTLLLLTVQYLLGLWTNLYAPSMFTSNTSFPALDWHYNIGYAVFVAAVVMLVFAALAKEIQLVVPAVIAVVAIVLAGVFGTLFVSSTPNNPVDSFWMGFMFLVAFGATATVNWSSMRRMRAWAPSQPNTEPNPAN